jgi:hypothetical protein
MATISDIKPSITQLSDEEAQALIKQLRFDRRQPPPKKTRKKTAAKKPVSTKALLNTLTPEQKAALIKQLGG